MKHSIIPIIVLAISAAALAGCSSPSSTSSRTAPATGAPATATLAPASSPTILAATSAPALPTATGAVSKPTPALTSPSIPFPGISGVEGLDSYDMTLRVTFRGTRDAQSVVSTEYYTRSFSLNPHAQFTTIQTADENGKPTILMQGIVGDVRYARTGMAEPCTARQAASNDRHIFNPIVLLKPMYRGKDLGQETVNSLPTRHYVMETLKNSDTEMSGDVWIAEKNAFVVKYTLQVKGGEQYFGKASNGEQTLAYELRNVGVNKSAAVPTGCLPPVTDLPAMPDAANVTRTLTELRYTTPSTTGKTVAFYQDQMKALGWSMESAPASPAQPTVGGPSILNVPLLPQVAGVDLSQFLPTRVPTVAAPTAQYSWMVFRLEKEQRRVHISIQPDGANVRVTAEIIQE